MLIPQTQFAKVDSPHDPTALISKISLDLEQSILAKIEGPRLSEVVDPSAKPIYIHRICRYFIKALDFVPHFRGADGEVGRSEDYKEFRFRKSETIPILCLINSSLWTSPRKMEP